MNYPDYSKFYLEKYKDQRMKMTEKFKSEVMINWNQVDDYLFYRPKQPKKIIPYIDNPKHYKEGL